MDAVSETYVLERLFCGAAFCGEDRGACGASLAIGVQWVWEAVRDASSGDSLLERLYLEGFPMQC